MSEKKSNFRTLAEALVFEKLGNAKIALDHLDVRRISIEELKTVIKEAFADAKKTSEVKAQTPTHGWGDADLEKEIKWVETLDLKEFFEPKEKEEEEETEEKEEE